MLNKFTEEISSAAGYGKRRGYGVVKPYYNPGYVVETRK